MSVSDAKRLKELETENGRLKKLLADSLLENEVTREVLRENGDRTSTARGGAGDGDARPERTARPDGRPQERVGAAVPAATGCDAVLRDRIVALTHRHRRYGAGMTYLKLRQEGRGQSQAGRSALRGGATPGETPATQEGTGRGQLFTIVRARRIHRHQLAEVANEQWCAQNGFTPYPFVLRGRVA